MSYFVADDGQKIPVTVSGRGSPLVLLHGWTSSHEEWYPFLAGLNDFHTIYSWDARGHGKKARLHSSPTVQRMAQDLRNLLEHYNLKNAMVVGHSMGALTLWQYIRDYGCDRLAKVAFIDQSPKLMTDGEWNLGIYGSFDGDAAHRFDCDLRGDFAESVLRLAAFGLNDRARVKYLDNGKGWEKSRQWLRQLDAPALVECWRSLVVADYRNVLDVIDIPALLIYGEESNFYHSDTGRYVASRIRNSILAIYEGTDHSPHQWQRDRFIADLRSFIDS